LPSTNSVVVKRVVQKWEEAGVTGQTAIDGLSP